MRKTLFLLIPLLLLLVLEFSSTNKRNPNIYLIRNNYVGWVQIIYNQEGFNAIEKDNGKYIFTIPESGVLKTSTPDVEYGESVSNSGKIEGPTVQRFFVGTEAELQNHTAPDYPVELMK
ncbi:hypothetical protein NSU18_09755 [Paenibacillus sp. FSL H8-0048]|uniref:DUF6843 domain-containing protein n=1 Tax=Paenibacillus sp. FSL H8-0048 TaxID=2954508 RepID=UPI0030FBBF4D